MKSFRDKPVGWIGESYRHYLASKGIRTGNHSYDAAKTVFGRIVGRTFVESDIRRRRVLDPERLKESRVRSALAEEAAIIPPSKEQLQRARKELSQRSRAPELLTAVREEFGESLLRSKLQDQVVKSIGRLDRKDAVQNGLSSDDSARRTILKNVKSKLSNENVAIAMRTAKSVPLSERFSPVEFNEVKMLVRERLDENPEEAEQVIRGVEVDIS